VPDQTERQREQSAVWDETMQKAEETLHRLEQSQFKDEVSKDVLETVDSILLDDIRATLIHVRAQQAADRAALVALFAGLAELDENNRQLAGLASGCLEMIADKSSVWSLRLEFSKLVAQLEKVGFGETRGWTQEGGKLSRIVTPNDEDFG